MVYVVVCVGVTAPWPFSGMLETSSCGIGGLIVTDVAFVVVQLMVLNWPTLIVDGEAERVAVGPCGGGGGFVVVDPPPAHEVTKIANNRSPTIPEMRQN